MIPEVPRPVYKPVKEKKGKKVQQPEPYHVKMIKPTVFNAILSTKGKGYVYQGEQPGQSLVCLRRRGLLRKSLKRKMEKS